MQRCFWNLCKFLFFFNADSKAILFWEDQLELSAITFEIWVNQSTNEKKKITYFIDIGNKKYLKMFYVFVYKNKWKSIVSLLVTWSS